MEKKWTACQEEAKQKFIDARGAWKWSAMWDTILELDPGIVASYARYSSVPDKRNYLDIRMRKFICIAIDSVTGCLNANGLKNHMKHALQLGIDVKEILEVLEITCMVGATVHEMSVPILVDELGRRGIYLAAGELSEEQKALKKAYMDKHNGYWSDEKENILKLDPEYFETFTEFEEGPWKNGPLSPKEKELIYLAVHAAPVTLHPGQVRYHISRALEYGATVNELADVLHMVSTLGIHAVTMGVPILKEAMKEVEAEKAHKNREG